MTKPPAMPEPIKTAVSKLKSAQMCNPNAVQHLIEEALAALQSAQPAEVSDAAVDLVGNELARKHAVYLSRETVQDLLARAILALRPAQQATPDAIREHLEGVASRASTGEQFNAFKWVIDTAFESLNLLPAQQATPEPAGEPFGWWFTEDPAVFSMPGSGFRRFPNKPQHTVECVPLYTHVAAQPVPMACAWAEDGETGDYATTCGHVFGLNDGGPADNGMKFCCYCGSGITAQAKGGE